MVGYEVEEQERSFEQKGITGVVTRGAIEQCQFPCIILATSKESQIPRYKLNVLATMIKNNNEVIENPISLYLSGGDKIMRLGIIAPRQVKAILDLFKENEKVGYLNKNKKLDGNYLYVLSE
jgi:hypothetical protein